MHRPTIGSSINDGTLIFLKSDISAYLYHNIKFTGTIDQSQFSCGKALNPLRKSGGKAAIKDFMFFLALE
jgi:hypothetical protein